jgi:hypothetical protein
MPITYDSIASQTLTSSTSSIIFSGIPSTYTDLVLVCSAQSTASANADTRYNLQFNSDTATNYSTTYLLGNGSVASSSRDTNRSQIDNLTPLSTSPQFTPIIFNINNYSNTTTFKTVLQRAGQNNNTSGGGGSGGILMGSAVSLWRSTTAINIITMNCTQNGQFATGSTFAIYGIKAA